MCMFYKVKSHIVLLSVLILVVFSGCSHNDTDSQYYDSAKQFNKIYFEVVENLETADTMKTLEKLQTEDNKKKIEKLGELLGIIEKNVPKKREKVVNNFKVRYADLVFLKDSYSKFNELSIDEKEKIMGALIDMGMNVENWKDKNSSIVWE